MGWKLLRRDQARVTELLENKSARRLRIGEQQALLPRGMNDV